MTDYTRVHVGLAYSENSDYSDPEFKLNWADYTLTPDEFRQFKLQIDTSTVSLDVTDFATVTLFAFKNIDTTNFVTVTWTDTAANSNTTVVPAGGFLVLSDIDPATNPTFLADTAATVGKLVVVGS